LMIRPPNAHATPVINSARREASWLSVASMLTDLAFETDPMGRFTAFGPGRIMGQPATRLLGVEAATLLSGTNAPGGTGDAISVGHFRTVITTICVECVAWHGTIQMVQPDGQTGIYRLSMAPRIADGAVVGTYGILFDLNTPDLDLPERHAEDVANTAFTHGQSLDEQTGLWSARNFSAEIARRCDRLDIEGLPGTLLCLGFARVKPLLIAPVAIRVAHELRDIMRPTDLLGRLDATTIGLWCDGMDQLTGAERAAKFCATFPGMLPEQSAIMVGVAARKSASGDDPATMIERARIALRLAETDAKNATPMSALGAWRVWQQE
ncbi:MAG: hypothetical protein POH28_12300, partial [Acidocella sp.]|nr:hypothetical protein [Acidocella sp.]